MASNDSNKAPLGAGTLNTDSLNYDVVDERVGDISDSDDYDPSRPLQDQYSVYSTYPKLDSPDPSTFAVPSASQSMGEALVPEMDQIQPPTDIYPSKTPSRAESRTSASMPIPNVHVQSKTRIVGGFVIEDEDEDDKGETEYEPPAVLGDVENIGSGSASIPEGPISENANEIVSTSGVSIQPPAPDMASSKVVSNSSYSPSVPVSSRNDASFAPDQKLYNLQNPQIGNTADSPAPALPTPTASAPRGRLPHDRVGIFEDRVGEDPRGDLPAWLDLVSEHRNRNRIESAREVYERFFKIFPSAAEQWVAYANMESENNELYRLEQVFNRTLLAIPNVQLWSVYLDYVRRRNPLTTDATSQARRIISSAYDLALQNIGMDKDSASIWMDYVEFIRSGPGNIGGSNWQDQQKMDLLRKAFQKAISVPTHAVNTLWKEYDQFEMGLNKLTGRKFLQERSPAYMTARSSYTELQNITRDLNRTTLPRLPPSPGCEGEDEFNQQVGIWRRWIRWEKGDPLVLKEEDLAGFKARVLYVYKQALMALRFVPDIWFEAAEFCSQHDMETELNELLKQGIEANPESCLLAFMRADRLEVTSESDQDSKRRGTKVREPYDKLLDALYDLISKARAQESQDVARIEKAFASIQAEDRPTQEDDEEDHMSEEKAKESAKKKQIDAAKSAHAVQISILSKTISFAWIALMRAMRRIQGKGKPGEMAGSRQVFADARKRGRITSDVYIASALIEYHCYKDPAATKIFERGAKLFPEDENFALEYLKHLIDINDVTNARAVFEMTVRKLASNPENVPKAKPIFAFLHEYESRYGDLVQVINLETRMRELFPDDPTLSQFAHRYSTPAFDPTVIIPIVSPSQTKPKPLATLDQVPSVHDTPTPRYLDIPSTNSPKRPLPLDEFDDDLNRPRKFIRADSPLKAGAVRRLDQQKRTQQVNGGGQPGGQLRPQPAAIPLPREIVNLLGIIPPASAYNAGRFSAEKLVDLIRRVEVPLSISQLRPPPQLIQGIGLPTMGMPPYVGGYPPGS